MSDIKMYDNGFDFWKLMINQVAFIVIFCYVCLMYRHDEHYSCEWFVNIKVLKPPKTLTHYMGLTLCLALYHKYLDVCKNDNRLK